MRPFRERLVAEFRLEGLQQAKGSFYSLWWHYEAAGLVHDEGDSTTATCAADKGCNEGTHAGQARGCVKNSTTKLRASWIACLLLHTQLLRRIACTEYKLHYQHRRPL